MNSDQLANGLKVVWQQHYDRRDRLVQATETMVSQFRESLEAAAQAVAEATRQPAHAVVVADRVDVPEQIRTVEFGLSSEALSETLSFRVEFLSDTVRYDGDYRYNQQVEYLLAKMNQKVYNRFKAPEHRR